MGSPNILSSQGLTLPGTEDTTGPLGFPAVQYDPSTGSVETPDLSSATNNYQILQAIEAELAAEGNANPGGSGWLCTALGIGCSAGAAPVKSTSFEIVTLIGIGIIVLIELLD